MKKELNSFGLIYKKSQKEFTDFLINLQRILHLLEALSQLLFQ